MDNAPQDWKDNKQQCSVTINSGGKPVSGAQVKLTTFNTVDEEEVSVTLTSGSDGKVSFCTLPPAYSAGSQDLNNFSMLQNIHVTADNTTAFDKDIDPFTDDVCKTIGDTISLTGGATTYSYTCSQDGACIKGSSSSDPTNLPVYQSTKSDQDAQSACSKDCGVFGRDKNNACVELTQTYKTLADLKNGGGSKNNSTLEQFDAFYPSFPACQNKADTYAVTFSSLPDKQPDCTDKKDIKAFCNDAVHYLSNASTCSDGYSCTEGSSLCKSTADMISKGSGPIQCQSAETKPTPVPPLPPCATKLDDKTDKHCQAIATPLGELSTDPTGFINSLFTILLSLSGGVALLLIIFSGYQLMISQGNPEIIKAAKERLTSAFIGILFLIFSLVILQMIGVDLLNLPGFGG